MIEAESKIAIIAILNDDYARTILEAIRRERLSVNTLSAEYNMSLATVSRRVNWLLDNELLIEHTHIDPDGHHYSEYEAKLDRVDIQLLETGFKVRVAFRQDPADRFARIWHDMRNE